MPVRIQLFDEYQTVKQYNTTISRSGNDDDGGDIRGGGWTEYYTKCSRTYSDCDHIECALAAPQGSEWLEIFYYFITVFLFVFCMPLLIPFFLFLAWTRGSAKEYEELREFRQNGTINGIPARQIK